MFFTYHTHKTNAARRKRKKLGQWNEDFAIAVWLTREGKAIKIRDMGNQHLSNTMKFLLRHAADRQIRLEKLLLCGPQPRGDWATEAFDDICAEQAEKNVLDYVRDIYWDMETEYKLRGLPQEIIDEYVEKLTATVAFNVLKALSDSLQKS